MALLKRPLNISFASGVDTKTDPKQVTTAGFSQPGQTINAKLLTLENATLQNTGEITKRNGNVSLNSPLSNGNALANFDNELIALDGQTLYSYSQEQNTFLNKGLKVSIDLSVSSIVKNSSQQTLQDSAYNNGLFCYVYTNGTVSNYTIVDQVTGQVIVSDKLIAASGVSAKVRAIGQYFVMFYVLGSDLNYVPINVSTPTTLGSPVTLVTDMIGTLYDVMSFTNLYIVYEASTLKSFTLSSTLVKGTSFTISGETAQNALTIFPDVSTSQIWIAYSSTNNIRVVILNQGLTVEVLAPTTIDTTSAFNITGIGKGSASDIYYECSNVDGLAQDEFIKKASVTNAGSVSSVGVFVRSVGLSSKAFLMSGLEYFLIVHQSTLQSTYFLIDSNQNIVAKIAQENAGGLQIFLASANVISSSQVEISYLLKDALTTVSGKQYTQTGLNSAVLTFGESTLATEIGENLHLSGGILSMYDGSSVVEHSFNLFPEGLQVQQLAFAGALPSGGSYDYEQTYEWEDNQGQLHRSSPGEATQFQPTLNESSFLGYLTSGSSTVKSAASGSLSAPVPVPKDFYVGIPVVGTNIPANTTIASITNIIPTGNGLTLSANATGSGLESIQGTPTLNITIESNGSRLNNSFIAQVILPSTMLMQIFPDPNNGNFVYTNTTGMQVGWTFTAGYGTSGNTYTITSISGTKVGITPSWADIGTTCTFSNGGSIPANAFLFPGMTLTLTSPPTGWPSSIVIQSVTSTTITCDQIIPYTLASGGTSLQQVSGTILSVYGSVSSMPTLRLTDKQNVSLQVYRTLDDQDNFQRVTSSLMPIINDKTVDYEYFVDGYSDLTLDGNDLLYTNGGVLDNIPSPATSIITLYQNRLLAVPSESPISFWYSQQVIPGDPVEFNDSLVWNVDSRGGAITALHQMDSNLILFKKNTIFYMNGSGPSPNGSNNDFTNPLLISTDSGCIDQKSLVIMPLGLMYKSLKGIYLLKRDLNVNYIGADVEAYNSSTITSSLVIDTLNQVRFTLDSGVILVYDYFVNQWYVFTNITAVDAVSFQNFFSYIKSDGSIYQEGQSLYTDNGSFIPIKAVTGWLSLSGIQGFERLYKFLVLGDYKSPHTLNVSFAYDFDSSLNQTTLIPVLSNPGVYQYRLFPKRQKCEAMQVTLQETQNSNFGQGLNISGLALEVGMKSGLNKLPAAKSYG